jgi:hypothetical protein
VASALSSSSRLMARASAPASLGGTTSAVSPSLTASRMAPTGVVTMGRAQSMACRIACGTPSLA